MPLDEPGLMSHGLRSNLSSPDFGKRISASRCIRKHKGLELVESPQSRAQTARVLVPGYHLAHKVVRVDGKCGRGIRTPLPARATVGHIEGWRAMPDNAPGAVLMAA